MLTMAPAHGKITVYMPNEMVADLDAIRAELVRVGVNVDRGRMVRAALTLASSNQNEWIAEMKRGGG